MPEKSEKQQTAFEIALEARKGKIPKEDLKGASRLLFNDKTLSTSQLEGYASTDREEIPRKVGIQTHRMNKRR
jgi:hypothetical protein